MLLLLAVTAAACSIGDKQAQAERLHTSVDRFGEGALTASMAFDLAIDAPTTGVLGGDGDGEGEDGGLAGLTAAGGGEGDGPARAATLASVARVEAAERAASVTIAGDDESSTRFFDTEVYVRRQNARPTERRHWARLDLAEVDLERSLDLEALEPPTLLRAAAATINPVYVIELVKGALAGSVERIGEEPVGQRTGVRYDFNLSFDKALSELDFGDEERATRLGVFRQFGATKDVVPATAWLGADGRLLRFRVELPIRVSRLTTHDLTLTVDLADATGTEPIRVPDAEETVDYGTFGRLGRAALPEGP